VLRFSTSKLDFAQKGPRRIGGKNISGAKPQSRKAAKKTSENAAALCVFAPLRARNILGKKTLFVQSPSE